MKAILIDASSRSVTEIDFDNTQPLAEVIGSPQFTSTVVRDHEIIIFLHDGGPDGFVLPLSKGHVRGRGKALILGSVGGRTVDTQLTPVNVQRGLFWTGEQG